MATMKHIKWKIKSVSNIKKMTKALEVVSTAKLQRIKKQSEQYRDFINEFFRIAKVVHEKVNIFGQEEQHPSDKTLLIVLSTEKGLCGPLNSKLFKVIFSQYCADEDQRKKVDVFCVWKKSLNFFVRTGFSPVGNAHIGDKNIGDDLSPLYAFLHESLHSGEYGSIKVCFNYFKNPLQQIPLILDLFPFDQNSLDAFVEQIGLDITLDLYLDKTEDHTEIVLDQGASIVRKEFMNQLMQHLLYGAVLQNKAGEFSSRMIAMKNAKDNASSMIDDLVLQFNKARQAAITQEISEIVSAKMAMD